MVLSDFSIRQVKPAEKDFTLCDSDGLYLNVRSYGGKSWLFRFHYAGTTVATQRQSNIHLRGSVTENEFVAMRQARDATLDMPALILPSIPVNLQAGELPPPESNGVRYLRIPLNAL